MTKSTPECDRFAHEFVAGVAAGYPEPQRREMLSELGIAIETAEPAEAEPSPIALSMGGRY